MNAVISLVRKEFLIDWKDKRAWSSVILYVLSTVYVVYLAFEEIVEPDTWNALLWVILLFTGFNVVNRTYDQDQGGRGLYLYTLVSPQQVFIAKTIYSGIFMMAAGLLMSLIYQFYLPSPATTDYSWFALTGAVLLGSLGITTTLGLVSAIAWKTGGNSGMVAILGFPVVVPLLLAIIRFSQGILSGQSWSFLSNYAYALVLLVALGVILGYLLFPYIWRD